MYDFISQNDLCVADFLFEQNVNYTYKHGSHESYIDHVLIPKFFSNQVTKCDILDSAEDNVSDDLAISSTFLVYVPHCKTERERCGHGTPQAVPLAKWSDAEFVRHYKLAVEASMENITMLDINSVESTAQLCIGVLNPNVCGKKKHWWTRECTFSKNRNRLFHYIWKSCGRPSSIVVYNCYKYARKT